MPRPQAAARPQVAVEPLPVVEPPQVAVLLLPVAVLLLPVVEPRRALLPARPQVRGGLLLAQRSARRNR